MSNCPNCLPFQFRKHDLKCHYIPPKSSVERALNHFQTEIDPPGTNMFVTIQCVHFYCLDTPLFPWTCVHCKDLHLRQKKRRKQPEEMIANAKEKAYVKKKGQVTMTCTQCGLKAHNKRYHSRDDAPFDGKMVASRGKRSSSSSAQVEEQPIWSIGSGQPVIK